MSNANHECIPHMRLAYATRIGHPQCEPFGAEHHARTDGRDLRRIFSYLEERFLRLVTRAGGAKR